MHLIILYINLNLVRRIVKRICIEPALRRWKDGLLYIFVLMRIKGGKKYN
jgi:hypothetical protein